MRSRMIAALMSAAALGGCATAQGMEHRGMSNEEMMQHCQMMDQHGHGPAGHDPTQHGGMSHEELMQHSAEIHERAGEAPR